MPKPHTFPTLFNEVKRVEISFLKKHGYLKPEQIQSGTINWSRNGDKTGSISIVVDTVNICPFIGLKYNFNDEPRKYRVNLISIPSNFGKGEIWYFRCPRTNKLCRKLYSIGGYFYHRNAFKGSMYECQIYSHKDRDMLSILNPYFNSDKYYEQLYKKNFKKTYAGKPTKKYLWLMERINKSENIDVRDVERFMII